MPGKILIVDDDIDTLQLVGTMLERQGYQILAANGGQKALDTAQDEKPDLVILDIMMPGMDGYEVARRLRANDGTAYIPIIMFTAKAQVGDKVEGFEAGADDYLTKPTHPAELIARVRTVLSRPKTGALVMEDGDTEPSTVLAHTTAIISAKGGLGVSTLAINLAVSLQTQSEERVILAELRPGHGDIGIYLGYTNYTKSLNNLLARKESELKPADVEGQLVTHGSGVQLLLSTYRPTDTQFSAPKQMETVVNALRRMSRYLVLDLGVGLPESTRKVLTLADVIIVVLEPTPHTIVQTRALLDALAQSGIDRRQVKAVLVKRERSEITLQPPEVQKLLNFPLTAVITPAPELAYQAAQQHEPMVLRDPESITSQQMMKLAALAAQSTPKAEAP